MISRQDPPGEETSFTLVVRGWPVRLVRVPVATVLLWLDGPRGYLFAIVRAGSGEVVLVAAPPACVLEDCLHLALLLVAPGRRDGLKATNACHHPRVAPAVVLA